MGPDAVPPPTRVDFSSVDRDEVEAFLTDMRGVPVRVDGVKPGQPIRHRLVTMGEVSVTAIDYPAWFGFEIQPMFAPLVLEVMAGRLERSSDGGQRQHYGPGDVTLMARTGESATGVAHDATIRSTTICPDLIARLITGQDLAPIRFTGLDPVSSSATTQWRQAASFVRGLMEGDAEVSLLVLDSAVRLLAAATLGAFSNSAPTEADALDRRDARPAVLRRAIALIESDPSAPITVTEIAAASFASVRAVQLAFRQHLDTTPMAYLRRVRLAGAHEDLLAGDPGEATVTQIASRWGVIDRSRFAAAYRTAYGCTPAETLNETG